MDCAVDKYFRSKVIAKHKLQAIFHSGHSGIGSDFPLITPDRWM